jgi:TetR/AcrR family transcriptional regulator
LPAVKTRKRGVGRPRIDRRRRERPPEEEILFAAAQLFAARGFSATSTRAIAAAAGLRQPSLFHWFPTKESILERLLETSLAPSLAFAERVAAEETPAAVRLYRILRFDVRHLCAYPYDPTAILLSPESRTPRFKRFWAERERLIAILRGLIEAGQAEGALAPADPHVAVHAVLAMNEGSLAWYRRGGRLTPEATSAALADLAMRALLRDAGALDGIRTAAGEDEGPS